jgi:hypothetical protein
MTHPTNWWISFSVTRYMRDGTATLLAGPSIAHPAKCQISAQRLVGDWMEPAPWFSQDIAHPTIELELQAGLKLYEQLAQAQVQVVSPAVAGIDGETYSLEFGSGFNIVKFRWFMQLPTEWQTLQPVAKRMEELGEQCLARAA